LLPARTGRKSHQILEDASGGGSHLLHQDHGQPTAVVPPCRRLLDHVGSTHLDAQAFDMARSAVRHVAPAAHQTRRARRRNEDDDQDSSANIVSRTAVLVVNFIPLVQRHESGDATSHGGYAKIFWGGVIGLFRSRASLEAEIMALRHQLIVLRRKSPKRLAFSNFDRLVFASLYRIAPRVVNALVIVEPETVIRWHRAGFRSFWRWKSRCRGGRPKVPLEIRQLIRAMSLANPLWGAPRIYGERLKLGIEIGQVAKYMARYRKPPSQGWKTFLRNHAGDRLD